MPEIPSSEERTGTVGPAKVRAFLMDQSIKTNLLDMDLQFSDKEIMDAMETTVWDFNEMDPQIVTVSVTSMPFAVCFLYGIAYYLLLAKLQEWMRSDLQYQAGNMTVSPQARRIEHFTGVAKMFRDEFQTRAKNHKLRINIASAYAAL